MPKKKLQFLVTEDIFNQFEAIRRSRFSSTAKQTLLYSIFSEWLSYQQRGNRVWEPSKNGVTDIPAVNVVTSPITSQKNTKTTTSFTSDICVMKNHQPWRSLSLDWMTCWMSVFQATKNIPTPKKANSHHSFIVISE